MSWVRRVVPWSVGLNLVVCGHVVIKHNYRDAMRKKEIYVNEVEAGTRSGLPWYSTIEKRADYWRDVNLYCPYRKP